MLLKRAKPEKMNELELEIFREHVERASVASERARELAKAEEAKTTEV